jgi:predicted transcriptional regulator
MKCQTINDDQMVQKYAFVMMTKEKWWNRFISDHHEGKRMQSYVQKGLAPPKNISQILFYVSKPIGEIAGYAEFVQRTVGEPMEVWEKHGEESVMRSEREYREFLGEQRQVSFIRFQNLVKAKHGLPLVNVLAILGMRRLSRKGFYIDKETAEKMVSYMD